MAFKLLVEVTDEGVLNVNHEGQIEPTILVGAIEMLKHSVLTTVDVMQAQQAMEALGGEQNEAGAEPGGE